MRQTGFEALKASKDHQTLQLCLCDRGLLHSIDFRIGISIRVPICFSYQGASAQVELVLRGKLIQYCWNFLPLLQYGTTSIVLSQTVSNVKAMVLWRVKHQF